LNARSYQKYPVRIDKNACLKKVYHPFNIIISIDDPYRVIVVAHLFSSLTKQKENVFSHFFQEFDIGTTQSANR